jgi:hypothetical protein
MLNTTINVSFLDSCIYRFPSSGLYKPGYESFLPVTYETIDSNFIQTNYAVIEPEPNPFFIDYCLKIFKLFTNTSTDIPDPVIAGYQATGSNFTSYTGFLASFYQDGQLKIFGYAVSGKIINYPISGRIECYIALEYGQQKGHSSYLITPHHTFDERYENGKSIHPPYIWGDDDVITTVDFSKWVREQIYYVIQSGIFLIQRRNIL